MSANEKINLEEPFTICGINWIIENSQNHFYITIIINDNKKLIKITEITDNDFLIFIEKIIIQNTPTHENIKYHIIFNIPLESYLKKATILLEKFESIDTFKILINNKEFSNTSRSKKSNDYNFNLNLFLEKTQKNNQIFLQNELVNSLITFSAIANFLEMQKITELHNTFEIQKFNSAEFMTLDIICIKSLNLIDEVDGSGNDTKSDFFRKKITSTDLDKTNKINFDVRKKQSVFKIINRCYTKSGVRLLKNWILQPLQEIDEIKKRLEIVELFVSDFHYRKQIRDLYLAKIPDLQTLNFSFSKFLAKKDFNVISLEQLSTLKFALGTIRNLHQHLKYFEGKNKELMENWYVENIGLILQKTEKLEELLNKSILFDKNLKEYIINNELNEELYNLRNSIDEKFNEISAIKNQLENSFGKNVKIHLEENANCGYVFYVGKAEGEKYLNKSEKKSFNLVSTNRAHVVLNNKSMEKISAEIKQLKINYKVKESGFHKKIIEVSASYLPVLERLIFFISELDVLAGFATMVSEASLPYAKPEIYCRNFSDLKDKKNNEMLLINSRHLILEWNEEIMKRHNPKNKKLVENDCTFLNGDLINIITGMNMGGKSTYLKQVGICVLLSHIGCYVPCDQAIIPLTDQIFTRMGAEDNPLKGISTFMNEMIEVSSMLNSATRNSLLLIDEIGRGTSSDNGVGLSYGILKYISEELKSVTLFATHFFELTRIVDFGNVRNYSTKHSIGENGEIFMEYKIIEGCGESSFGLNLMKLIGFDSTVIELMDKVKEEEEIKGNDK